MGDRFADIKILLMSDNIHYLRLCGMLLSGKGIDDGTRDTVSADNMLYNAFGMSSEDILKKFLSAPDVSVCK